MEERGRGERKGRESLFMNDSLFPPTPLSQPTPTMKLIQSANFQCKVCEGRVEVQPWDFAFTEGTYSVALTVECGYCKENMLSPKMTNATQRHFWMLLVQTDKVHLLDRLQIDGSSIFPPEWVLRRVEKQKDLPEPIKATPPWAAKERDVKMAREEVMIKKPSLPQLEPPEMTQIREKFRKDHAEEIQREVERLKKMPAGNALWEYECVQQSETCDQHQKRLCYLAMEGLVKKGMEGGEEEQYSLVDSTEKPDMYFVIDEWEEEVLKERERLEELSGREILDQCKRLLAKKGRGEPVKYSWAVALVWIMSEHAAIGDKFKELMGG